MPNTLIRWAIFSVIISLLPFGLSALVSFTNGTPVDWGSFLGRGELLLVAAALCAAAVGELLGTSPQFGAAKILGGGAAIIMLMIASYYFAHVSSLYATFEVQQFALASMPNVDKIGTASGWIFAFAVLASGSCVALAEV